MIAAHCDFLLLTADSELVVSVFCALLAERSPANFHFQFRSYFSLSGWGWGLGAGWLVGCLGGWLVGWLVGFGVGWVGGWLGTVSFYGGVWFQTYILRQCHSN